MRFTPRHPGCAALVLALLACLATGASGAEPAPGAEELKIGMQAYRNRDYAAAIGPLEIASRTAPRPSALISLGYCYRQLKRFPEAIRAYQRYLEAGFEEEARVALLLEQTMDEEREWKKQRPEGPVAPAGPPPVAQDLAAPAPAAPLSPAPAAAVPPPVAPALGVPAAPPPVLAVRPAEAPAASVGAVPPEAVASVRPSRPRLWTWVAGGAAVASLGTGLALGLMSAANAREIENSEHTGAEVASLRDKVKWQAQKGNLFVGIGAGLAVVSAGLFVFQY